MKILGITMAAPLIYEQDKVAETYGFGHDSAAVLIEDDRIITAVEEERFNRLKHSNKAPILAMRYCLDSNNLTIDQIDAVAINFTEEYIDLILNQIYMSESECINKCSAREYIHRAIYTAFKKDISDEKIYFIPHHKSHGMSAYYCSGFRRCLNVVIDGLGDGISGTISIVEDGREKILRIIPYDLSLGRYYLEVIRYLGYEMFDEYKIMGLAPYGNKEVYKAYFEEMYELKEDGNYIIRFDKIHLLQQLGEIRKKGDPFTQKHKDIAAALQDSLEKIVMHFLKYYQSITGEENLCLSGGVAQNCSLNGKIYYSKLFKKIFVQPASYDAGSVIGAARSIIKEKNKEICFDKLRHVYYGWDINNDQVLQENIEKWSNIIDVQEMQEPIEEVTKLLIEQKVIAWVQGRAEFGPRALGNRSILADPRPYTNRERINKMIKKREQYRPFAPSVVEEHVYDYFNIVDTKVDFSYMNFVVEVLEEKRETLGAITHVDGTARIQTVSRKTNPAYYDLINSFGKSTGIYMLLNTSFNNNVEPIVNSVDDAITTFLTTELDYLVINNYLISRKKLDRVAMLEKMEIKVPEYTKFIKTISQYENKMREEYIVKKMKPLDMPYNISKELYELLELKMMNKVDDVEGYIESEMLADAVYDLWEKRYIYLIPR